MANKYVAPWGSNSNNGDTPTTPYLTVVFGAGHLSPGDTLFCRQNQNGSAGYFDENLAGDIPTGSIGNVVSIKNYPGETVWIRSPYTGTSQNNTIDITGTAQYITLDGINIDCSLGSNTGIACQDTTNHITLQNCEILGTRLPGDEQTSNYGLDSRTNSHHNTFKNIKIHGFAGVNSSYGAYIHGDDNILESLDIYDVGARGIQIYDGTGHLPSRNIIRYCKIHDIVTAYDGRRTGIVFMGDSHEIYYNLIYNITGPTAIGIDFFTSGLPTNTHCYNNTVFNCSYIGYNLNSCNSTNLFKNNIAYQNGTNITNSGNATLANNLTDGTNPLFVSSSTGNFQLTGASVAINTGVSVGLTRDILGIVVPQQTNPCKGCYEFVLTVPTPTPPAAPTNFTATSISSSQINLAWTNNGAGTLVFSIERRTGNNAFAIIFTTAAGATSYSNTGLTQNTTYDYRIRAFDGSLYSLYSSISSATTAINFPAAPTSLILTVISDTEIDLSWTNNGPGTLRFPVERRIGTNAFQEITRTAAGVVTYNNTGLAASTTYEYRVRAYDGLFYSPYLTPASATTNAGSTPPPPPSPPPVPTLIRWQVIFSKPVSGVNAAQFELSGTPVNSSIVSVVPQFTGTYGTAFIVNVQLGPGSGTLGLNLKATGNIRDKAGNVLTVPFPGQLYLITV